MLNVFVLMLMNDLTSTIFGEKRVTGPEGKNTQARLAAGLQNDHGQETSLQLDPKSRA